MSRQDWLCDVHVVWLWNWLDNGARDWLDDGLTKIRQGGSAVLTGGSKHHPRKRDNARCLVLRCLRHRGGSGTVPSTCRVIQHATATRGCRTHHSSISNSIGERHSPSPDLPAASPSKEISQWLKRLRCPAADAAVYSQRCVGVTHGRTGGWGLLCTSA